MRALPSFTASLWFASALGLFIGCSSSSPDSGGPSASDDAAATMGDAPSCAADATATSCCCAGDVQEAPVCSAAGTLSCGTGYGLYHGADCSCSTGAQNTLDAGDASDADVCPAPNVLRYETAGCGDSAHPVCGRSDQDACAIAVCGCDGTTLVKCDYASTPWSHLGACTGDDAAAGCSVTNTSSLTGVSLAFRAPIGCTFTLAQAWLFAWLDEGGARTGDILSIVATCIAHDVNPGAYLHRVVHCIVHGWPQAQLRELLPDRMLAAHPELYAGDPDDLPMPATTRALSR